MNRTANLISILSLAAAGIGATAASAEPTPATPSMALIIGSDVGYSRVIAGASNGGGEGVGDYHAHGGLISTVGSVGLEFNPRAAVSFGLRFAVGQLQNSDDSTGSASRIHIGPSLRFMLGRASYLRLGGSLDHWSFDDVTASVSGAAGFPDRDIEVDGESITTVSAEAELGAIVPINPRLDLLPAIKFSSTISTLSMDGTDVSRPTSSGSCCERDDANSALIPSVSVGLAISLAF